MANLDRFKKHFIFLLCILFTCFVMNVISEHFPSIAEVFFFVFVVVVVCLFGWFGLVFVFIFISANGMARKVLWQETSYSMLPGLICDHSDLHVGF